MGCTPLHINASQAASCCVRKIHLVICSLAHSKPVNRVTHGVWGDLRETYLGMNIRRLIGGVGQEEGVSQLAVE